MPVARRYRDGMPDPPVQTPRVTLITRPGCHLCDEARAVVSAVVERTGSGWCEVDVDSDPRLAARYAEQLPVVLLDGARHAYWTVDAERLEAALVHRGARWGGWSRGIGRHARGDHP